MSAADYFLKIDGIPGEAQDKQYRDWIQLESWSWGASQGGSMSYGGGGGAGKVQMQDFHFVMKVNRATPKLIAACAKGEHIKQCILAGRKAGGVQQEFMRLTFANVLISSYNTSGSGQGDAIPMEQISFNYEDVEFQYREQKEDGTVAGAITTGYNLKKQVSR